MYLLALMFDGKVALSWVIAAYAGQLVVFLLPFFIIDGHVRVVLSVGCNFSIAGFSLDKRVDPVGH